jgi:hypothetical protein
MRKSFDFKPRHDPVVDMGSLAREISDLAATSSAPSDYGPPEVRADTSFKQILSFGELPTREIDELLSRVEAELAELKNDAQAVRDLYTKHTSRIAADIQRLQEEVRLSMQTMKTLRQQCAELDKLDLPALPPKETSE